MENKRKQTAAVILAAGLSSRMGDFKPLMKIGDVSVIQRIITTFRLAGCDPIVVVTGFNEEKLRDHLSGQNIIFLHNPDYANTQMFDSAKIAFKWLDGKCESLFFTPGDIPLFSVETLRRLRKSESSAAVPYCRGKTGHPLFLKSELLSLLCAYGGEGGMKKAMEIAGISPEKIIVDDPGTLYDADTQEEFQRLVAYHKVQNKDSARTIYVIRHGAIREQGEERRYMGRTDLPLTKEGKNQALRLKEFFRTRPVTAVFSSPLTRCVQTAELAFPNQEVIQVDELTEQNCGQWENLTFSEVRRRYPEEYGKRGEDLAGIAPLGGENLYDCLGRMMTGIRKILAESEGDIAIVAHSTMNRVLLAKLQGSDVRKSYEIPQPESCINRLRYEENEWIVELVGETPHRVPDDIKIQKLLDRYGVSQKIKNHMNAVAEMAEAMRQAVLPAEEIDRQLLRAAAYLHDIAREQKNHAAVAKERLKEEGYLLVGEIISQHHDLQRDEMSASFLLNLADKYCFEDHVVTLEDRFSKSREKCRTEEALQCHNQRYTQALVMEKKLKKIAGIQKEIPVWFRERRKYESDI